MAEAQGSHPILEKQPTAAAGFEYTERPCRDLCWAVLFIGLVGLTLGFGIYAGVNKYDDASELFNQDYLTDPDLCPVSDGQYQLYVEEYGSGLTNAELEDMSTGAVRSLKQTAEAAGAVHENSASFLEFLDAAWVWILAATGIAVALGFIFLLLFSYFASVMVYTVAALLITVPLGVGIILLVLFDDHWGWAYICAGVVIAIPIFCFHSQLRLSAKLLDLGADGIRDNLDLVLYSICSNLVLLACLTGLLCFAVLALLNGKIVPNDRANFVALRDRGECISRHISTFKVDCCDWDRDNYVPGYLVLIVIMIIWVIFLIGQIRVYVVSGVVSQWYFADEGERGNMSITKSLGFALGPSFGSLVLSSMILTISNIIHRLSQWLAKQAAEENSRFKFLAMCCSCLIGAIAHIIEWVTDFGTVRMAITGESFFQAGKNVVMMMKNNLINAYAIWWFPPIVLFVCSFILSVSASVVLALAARNAWNDDDDKTDVRKWSWFMFIISFLLIMAVLNFFSTMLIDAANTIFVCFAIDRENKTEKNPKAHEVFTSLGLIGDKPPTELP